MSLAEISDYLEKINAAIEDLSDDKVGDVSNFGESIVMPRIPEFEIQFFNDNPEDLETTILVNATGSASSTETNGKGVFSSGTDATAQYTLRSRKVINSAAAREQYLIQNISWPQPPTDENDVAEIGFYDEQVNEGFTWGYNGRKWGITHYRDGNEITFIPRLQFNKDTLSGNDNSKFTSDDTPVEIDLNTLNTFRI